MCLRRGREGSVGDTHVVEHEAVVLGGGPAGAAAAIVLARRGHDVGLVRPAAPPAGALGESIPPSARKLLDRLGVLERVVRAGFLPNGGNTSWWAGGAARVERFGRDETGFQVDRAGLEAVLAEAAHEAGVTVHEGVRARRVEREGWSRAARLGGRGDAARRAAHGGADGPKARGDAARPVAAVNAPWRLACADGRTNGAFELLAAWLIDATGRHGLLARRVRRSDRRTSTVALVRRWRRPGGWPLDDPTHTLLESYRDGWAWSVPLAPEVRCFTAMIDAGEGARPRRSVARGGRAPADLLDAELAKTVHLRALLEGAEPVEAAWACPASLYDARSYGETGLLLAGDAGSFIDPLSSYGVKKALSSGWLAGVVAHTALVDAAVAGEALAFFDAREREVYRRYRLASVPYLEEAAAAHAHPYWVERAEAAAELRDGAHEPAPDDPDALLPPLPPEADVRAAFETIRVRPALDAALAPTARVVDRPSVEGERIRLAPHVASDAWPQGLRWVRGVDLARLVEHAPRHGQVPDLWAAYNGEAVPVALPDFLVALSTAFAAGVLVHRD